MPRAERAVKRQRECHLAKTDNLSFLLLQKFILTQFLLLQKRKFAHFLLF